MARIVIDAGHGGTDPGAVYQGRQEKDDVLRLAMALGDILKQNGIDVVYTRTTDVYQTPYQKAVAGNNANADLFVSLHRNASVTPGVQEGIETLVYADQGLPAQLARNINTELEELGFQNRGVVERPGLVVLRRTKMPSVLVEAGFIDNESDNARFDQEFENIAQAIAEGILQTLDVEEESASSNPMLYRVQVGAYKTRKLADQLLVRLQREGYPAFLIYEDGLYKVQVGAFAVLDNAIRMEQRLRRAGYNTWITT